MREPYARLLPLSRPVFGFAPSSGQSLIMASTDLGRVACFASTAHDRFAVTDLAEKRARPEIAARAVNVNSFAVEIDYHGVIPLIHAAYSSDWSWLTALRSWSALPTTLSWLPFSPLSLRMLSRADCSVHGDDVERRIGEVEAAGGVVRGGGMTNDECRVANETDCKLRISMVELPELSHSQLGFRTSRRDLLCARVHHWRRRGGPCRMPARQGRRHRLNPVVFCGRRGGGLRQV